MGEDELRAREQLIAVCNGNSGSDGHSGRDDGILVAAVTGMSKVELYAVVDCRFTSNPKYLKQEITDAIVALKAVERKLRDSGETRTIESAIYCARLPPDFKTPGDVLGRVGEIDLSRLETAVSEANTSPRGSLQFQNNKKYKL